MTVTGPRGAAAPDQVGMHVRKRNGDREPVDVGKIVRAVQRCVYRFKTNRMVSDLGFIGSATPPGSTR